MVMVRNSKSYKWFIYGYGLVGQNIWHPRSKLKYSVERNIVESDFPETISHINLSCGH